MIQRLGRLLVAIQLMMAGEVAPRFEAARLLDLPPLSSLVSDCTLTEDWMATAVPLHRPISVWLVCGSVRMIVVHPENLIGKVTIRNQEQALELLRFFTSDKTSRQFRYGGCVEITDDPQLKHLIVIPRNAFRRYLRPPVSEVGGVGAARSFVWTRSLICPDQRIYSLREEVLQSGYIEQLSKEVLIKSGRTVGVVLWPDGH